MPSTIAGIVTAGQRDLRRREGFATRMLVDRYTLLWQIITGEIATIERQILAAQQAGEIDDAERWVYRQRWYEQLQDSVGTELQRFTDDGLRLIAGVQQDAVSVALNGARQISRMAGISTPFAGRVNAAAMERYVSALQPGSPLRGVFARYSDQTQRAIMDGIFEGMGRREGTGSIVRAVRAKAGPDVSTGKLATITRTETMRAYRGSARDSYEALGPDVIHQWEWRAAKSARTCAACLAYDGRRFPYKQYPDRFHVCCRCVIVPVPHKHLVGEVPERETGAEWLARQDEKTQRKVLGTKDRYALYQDGVPLRDFIGVKHNRTWGPSLYVKPARKVRPPQITSSFRTVEEAQSWIQERYPEIQFDLGGLHVDTVTPLIRQFDQLATQYPDVAGRLRYMGTYENAPESIRRYDFGAGMAHVHADGKAMAFNPKYFSDPEFIRSAQRRGVSEGFLVEGSDTIESTMTHEFGHLVDWWLRDTPRGVFEVMDDDRNGFVNGTLARWKREVRPDASLSQYALTNDEEAFAEGFASIYHTPRDRWHPYVQKQERLLQEIADPTKWRSLWDMTYLPELEGEERRDAERKLQQWLERFL